MKTCVALLCVSTLLFGVSCRSTPEKQEETRIEPQGETALVEPKDNREIVAETETTTDEPVESLGIVQMFSHVRVDQTLGIVEFDGWVPIDCHDPRTPDVWLEQVVCITDTLEHESLVVSLAKPSEVHAAMLLVGLEPGKPGSYRWDGQCVVGVSPEGDAVGVTFVHEDDEGNEVVSDPLSWVVDVTGTRSLGDGLQDRPAFVFGGSRFVAYNGPEVYDADMSGTLIGLATFGGETIAFTEVISHEAMYQEPEWLANAKRVPEYGTKVRVRLVKLEK